MAKEDELKWYHGRLSREASEQMLKESGDADGTFLVRESNSSSGDFVLSVLFHQDVAHYQIIRHGEDAFFSVDEQTTIHGLDSLVEYYQEDKRGLVCKLGQAVLGDLPPHDSRRNGRTNLLHRATKEGNFTVVSELLKSGYRLEAKNQDGQTAVHLACMVDAADILQTLITAGANVNCRDLAGYTPLHYACRSSCIATLQLLVGWGKANVQARNTRNGWVPLHEAAASGREEVVRLLLSLGAPARPRTADAEVPAQLARAKGHMACARILEEHRAPAPLTCRSQWYHGTLDRKEAVDLFGEPSDDKDGHFLVRWSDKNSGHVLTMMHDKQPYHFIIHEKGDCLYIDDGPYLDSLEHVVEYYSSIADGLPTVLKLAIPPRPKPPVPEFSTIPRRTKSRTPRKRDHSSEGIALERLELKSLLGEGEFGSVYKGEYRSPDGACLDVAVKTLRADRTQAAKEAFLREAQVMINLKHHCIVRLVGVCQASGLMMVQELIALGSMLTFLLEYPDKASPGHELKLWAAQIACGMQYLEENRFVHRDLAARNILLASRNQAKISDFGLSRALGAGHEYYRASQGGKWPLRWYAPESFNYGTFSHASDVWSYGVTLWEMFSYGQQPYGNFKGTQVIAMVESGQRLEQPSDCPDHIYDIMQRCWAYDAAQRPSFQQLTNIFTSDTEYANIRDFITSLNLD